MTKPKLGSAKPAHDLLEMYFLDARSHLLETAAILDRIERGEGGVDAMADPRVHQLRQACDILKDGGENRAEQFLMLFSEPD